MAYNYEWPYVGTDKWNADWLLSKMKELIKEWEDLNIPQEVINAIIKALSDGTINLTANGYVTPQMFGAKGDGTTDDTAAIKKAVSSLCEKGGGIIVFPPGTYGISETITIGCTITILGAGCDRSNLDSELPLTRYGSALRWIGETSGIMLQYTGSVGGLMLSNLALEGNGKASIGIDIDRLRNSVFQNLTIYNTVNYGMNMKPRGSVDNDNCMNNHFDRIHIRGAQISIYITGPVNANCCFNTFTAIAVDYTSIGVRITNADNNTFIHLNGYSRGGSYTLSLETPTARSNYFLHFSGNVHATGGSSNAILFFDRDNSNAEPVVDSTSKLFYSSSCNNALGWHFDTAQYGINAQRTGSYNLPIIAQDTDIIQATAPEYGVGGAMTGFNPGNFRGCALTAGAFGEQARVPALYWGTWGVYALSLNAGSYDVVIFASASKPSDSVFFPWRPYWKAGDFAFNLDVPNNNSPLGWRFNGTTWKTVGVTIS